MNCSSLRGLRAPDGRAVNESASFLPLDNVDPHRGKCLQLTLVAHRAPPREGEGSMGSRNWLAPAVGTGALFVGLGALVVVAQPTRMAVADPTDDAGAGVEEGRADPRETVFLPYPADPGAVEYSDQDATERQALDDVYHRVNDQQGDAVHQGWSRAAAETRAAAQLKRAENAAGLEDTETWASSSRTR